MTNDTPTPASPIHDGHVRLLARGVDALTRLDDDELDELQEGTWQLAERFGYVAGQRDLPPLVVMEVLDFPPAARAVLDLVLVHLWAERDRRNDLEDNARIALEANGHEVFIGEDRNAAVPWFAFCSCSDTHVAAVATREEAVELAGEHAREHGGKWAEGYP